MPYANKSNATRAARKALASAPEGSTMTVWQSAAGWDFRVEAPEPVIADPEATPQPVEQPAEDAPKPVVTTAEKPVTEPLEGVRKSAPTGKAAIAIELASRPEGATRKELIAATGWSSCPWKWYFSNPQNTGLCDRYGYGFEARKKGRTATYHVTVPN